MCDKKTKTRFITIPIVNTPNGGIKMGDGACKGVRLKLNAFVRNTAGLVHTPFFAYYGDAKEQEIELMAVDTLGTVNTEWSKLIECTDLNQVFIRYSANAGWPATAYVQVMITEDAE